MNSNNLKYAIMFFYFWGRMMRNKPVLMLLHNLGMILFVLLIAANSSPANQIILSAIAVMYWLTGYVVIYRRNR